MKKIFHPANQRGLQNHGWLKAAHSFSFGNFHDSSKMNFGLLRVLNDDIVAPGMGFGMHSHDNMEIVTIPLQGVLAHKDSLGSEGTIKLNEVQIMSAGMGIRHSEFNGSATEAVNLLQIWVFPKEKNIEPRYDQKQFAEENFKNRFQVLVSPSKEYGAMWINQDAFFSLGEFDSNTKIDYTITHQGNGAYVFLIEGNAMVEGQNLSKRDALGIYETVKLNIAVTEKAKILIIDVPMDF